MLESVGLGEDLGSSGMPKYLEMLWIFPKIVSFNIFHKVKAKTNAMVLKNLPFFFLIIVSLYYIFIFCYEKKKTYLSGGQMLMCNFILYFGRKSMSNGSCGIEP